MQVSRLLRVGQECRELCVGCFPERAWSFGVCSGVAGRGQSALGVPEIEAEMLKVCDVFDAILSHAECARMNYVASLRMRALTWNTEKRRERACAQAQARDNHNRLAFVYKRMTETV